MKNMLKYLSVAGAMLFWAAAPVAAQGLDAIVKRGKVLIAMDLGSPPYAMTNQEQKPEGADVEVAQLLAKDLGVELEIVQTNGQGRIPSLLSGKADFVIATFSITPERAKSVTFSSPYGVVKSVIFADKNKSIKGLDDLVGKKTGVARGTTPDAQLPNVLPKGADIVRFDDDATTISALASGQIDALGTAADRMTALNKRFPGRFEIKYDVDVYYYSVGMRRGDPDLLHWVNTWVFLNMQNGKLRKIYEKWLEQPLPALPSL